MFVAGEVLLDLSFPAEEARLANLARGRVADSRVAGSLRAVARRAVAEMP
jgi:hypothetical protein